MPLHVIAKIELNVMCCRYALSHALIQVIYCVELATLSADINDVHSNTKVLEPPPCISVQ